MFKRQANIDRFNSVASRFDSGDFEPVSLMAGKNG